MVVLRHALDRRFGLSSALGAGQLGYDVGRR
jgi:hypothetical protein